MTTYKEIFDLALRKIDDPDLAKFPEEDLSDELYGWLESAIAGLPKLRSQLSERDEFDVENVETKGFSNTLSDTTKRALALAMVREWLGQQIKSTRNTLQRFSKKEGYSSAEHLKSLMSLDDSINSQILKLLRDDSYVDNEYFD